MTKRIIAVILIAASCSASDIRPGLEAYLRGQGAGWTAPSGAIAHWSMTGYSDSAGTNDLYEPGGLFNAPIATNGVDGGSNGAYFFDGNDDGLQDGDLAGATEGTNQLTISAWIYPDDVSGTYPRILDKADVSVDSAQAYQFMLNNADVGFRVRTGGTWQGSLVSASNVTAGAWHHVVGIYNGSAVYIYVNNSKETTDASASGNINDTADPVFVGIQGNLGNDFDGAIDAIRIYNRALSDSEVQTLYEEFD